MKTLFHFRLNFCFRLHLVAACLYNNYLDFQDQRLSIALSALSAMASDYTLKLWNSYMDDFITHKLKLIQAGHSPLGNIAHQIWYRYFTGLLQPLNKLQEMLVWLHYYGSTYHAFLGKMATTLHSLTVLEKVRTCSRTRNALTHAMFTLVAARETNCFP